MSDFEQQNLNYYMEYYWKFVNNEEDHKAFMEMLELAASKTSDASICYCLAKLYQTGNMMFCDRNNDIESNTLDEMIHLFKAFQVYQTYLSDNKDFNELGQEIAIDIASIFDRANEDVDEGEKANLDLLYKSEEELAKLIEENPIFTIDGDHKKNALRWYKIAADLGEVIHSAPTLALAYEEGILVSKDTQKAIHLYQQYFERMKDEDPSKRYIRDFSALIHYTRLNANHLSTFEIHSLYRWAGQFRQNDDSEILKSILEYKEFPDFYKTIKDEIIKENKLPTDQNTVVAHYLNACIAANSNRISCIDGREKYRGDEHYPEMVQGFNNEYDENRGADCSSAFGQVHSLEIIFIKLCKVLQPFVSRKTKMQTWI